MTHSPRKRHRVADLARGLLRSTPRRTRGTTRPAVEALEGRALLASVVGSVTMPYDGTLSAAVYDGQGHLVKPIYQGVPEPMGQKVSLTWDGTDQSGNPVPNNVQYQWKAAFSRAGGVPQGSVGNSGSPSFGPTKANGGVDGVATDPSGNLYSISWWEEMHNELRKYGKDGSTLWEIPSVGG
jgi:FlgD Ig-like domain